MCLKFQCSAVSSFRLKKRYANTKHTETMKSPKNVNTDCLAPKVSPLQPLRVEESWCKALFNIRNTVCLLCLLTQQLIVMYYKMLQNQRLALFRNQW